VLNLETGQRGLLLTAQEEYLEPYQGGIGSVWESLARISQYIDDIPGLNSYATGLRDSVRKVSAQHSTRTLNTRTRCISVVTQTLCCAGCLCACAADH
jgi:CHASE3 domain sensor protein